MTISVNDSPLAGREGDKVQSRVIRDRLLREAEGNVAIRVREVDEAAYEVAGRGELQLGVLIETMRREGFELAISRPRVLYKQDETTGQRLEPIEELTIDVDEPYAGIVIEKVSSRKGELRDMRASASVGLAEVAYGAIPGLSREMVERLEAARPATLADASRLRGITPAALAVVLVHARKQANAA